MSSFVPKPASDLAKLQPLDGLNYRRWAVKMLIHIESAELEYVLTYVPEPAQAKAADSTNPQTEDGSTSTPASVTPEPVTTDKSQDIRAKFERDNKTVRGLLLHHMSDNLLDIYAKYKSAKEIWDMLKRKYGADDAGRRKYTVGRWLNYRMVDTKPVIEQVHEYENLVSDLEAELIPVSEVLQTYALLEKLPESWGEFQNKVKHESKDYSWEEMVNHINIEDAYRQRSVSNSGTLKANMVESSDVKGDRSRTGSGGQNKGWKRGVKANNNNKFKNN
ncbi:PREDICTED: uncharacterized protein LOC109158015 [Ipomoea nil]|uniref:uncharacterized protein LOC109158015 n=1 Tax=Ipomoea nil TaxID=35883 RepID=UPI000901D861|nr:PREDICTED: uncharacterized protein LOC109158015 [Ipomoea nil]